MKKISSFIVCKNEEASIEKALESLKAFSDEIVVVDDSSTDATRQICQRFTQNIFTFNRSSSLTSFAELRNFALSKCHFEWIFYLDADEFCSPELIQWLKDFKNLPEETSPKEVSASPSVHPLRNPRSTRVDMYEVRRLEHFMGYLYRYGAGNPSHQWRLFRKGIEFQGRVHEYQSFEGEIRRLERPIMHFPKSTPQDVISKMNQYTSLDAEQLFAQGKVKPASYMFFSGAAMFLKAYFRKQGFRDGGVGLFLAIVDGFSFFLKQAKLYFLNKKAGRL